MDKALGSELTEFYTKYFPEGYYHDDYNEEIDPDNFIATEKYDLRDLGYIIKADNSSDEKSFSSVFLKWKRSQTHVSFLVTVPKESLNEAKAAVKALGYSIS